MNPALMVAAALAARRNAVVKALEQARAFDASSALSLEALPDNADSVLDAICKQALVVRTAEGRYYLDRAAQQRQREQQAAAGKVAIITLLALTTVFAGFLLYAASR